MIVRAIPLLVLAVLAGCASAQHSLPRAEAPVVEQSAEPLDPSIKPLTRELEEQV
jgi:hypothetical protein